jgi:hypothetical protein
MKPTYLLPLLATFALTSADSNDTSPETGFGPGPNDTDVFRQASISPNATGLVNLDASNMMETTNTFESVTWRAHLNITEVTNLNFMPSPSTDVITNSVIGIDTFGAWVANSNWDTNIINLDVARNATVDGQKDKGDCHATLGQTCVEDYTAAITSSIILAAQGSPTNANYTPMILLPPVSCKNRPSDSSITNRMF